MVNFYLNTAGKSFIIDNKLNENEKKKQNQTRKYHRCIAALICHPPKETPYVAVLCTGTKTNHQECYSTRHEDKNKDLPCDGHAESLCYEIFPIYSRREMLNCLEGKQSIFEPINHNDSFTLKPNIEFHLLVTEPPCGWIRHQKDPCMEWKIDFEKAPHIPTCSSRILIGSKMGIQGYVSHLLKECIFIKSLVILCAMNGEHQKTEFNSSAFPFDLPTISTLKYNPDKFNPRITTFKPMNLVHVEVPHTVSHSNEYNNQSNQKEVNRRDDDNDDHEGKDQKDCKCAVAIDQSVPRNSTMKWSYNPREGSEKDENDTKEKFSISEKIVEVRLLQVITKEFQAVRRKEIEKEYAELTALLNLSDALQQLISEFDLYNAKKKEGIKKITSETADLLCKQAKELLDGEYIGSKKWDTKGLDKGVDKFKKEGKRLIDSQNLKADLVKLLKSMSNIIIDCSWKKYFDKPTVSVESTE